MLSQLVVGWFDSLSCCATCAIVYISVISCAISSADLPGHLCIHGSTVAKLPGPVPWHQLLFPAELAAGPQQPLALALPMEQMPTFQR